MLPGKVQKFLQFEQLVKPLPVWWPVHFSFVSTIVGFRVTFFRVWPLCPPVSRLVYQVTVFSRSRLYLTKVKWTCRTRIGHLIDLLSDFSEDSFFLMVLCVVVVWGFCFARCANFDLLLKVLNSFCGPKAFLFSDC